MIHLINKKKISAIFCLVVVVFVVLDQRTEIFDSRKKVLKRCDAHAIHKATEVVVYKQQDAKRSTQATRQTGIFFGVSSAFDSHFVWFMLIQSFPRWRSRLC